mmetsp:Transcript_28085/g.45109  ORF Transcript_28085/g.45109 Transcript_28085/m.45109 type:complete len:116 (-) Transcript_28085:884-1231(-)
MAGCLLPPSADFFFSASAHTPGDIQQPTPLHLMQNSAKPTSPAFLSAPHDFLGQSRKAMQSFSKIGLLPLLLHSHSFFLFSLPFFVPNILRFFASGALSLTCTRRVGQQDYLALA